MVISNISRTFRDRARHEAARYGTDPWVFVRELLQNSRDAGAHHVWFECSSGDGRDRVICRDDGCGMTYEHAQHYLFSLYASSKRGRPNTAGRFGIGFWAVLRFEPAEIIVRSRAPHGRAWQLRLDGQLEESHRESTTMPKGTEVVLERRATGSDLEALLTASILRDAPFLRCRHRTEHPLEVCVNGRLVRAEPQLSPPSLSFRRRGLRGTVGLGSEPRAEVYAHGFRIRDAATLDELLAEDRPQRSVLSGARKGLAPRVIIDSSELEVLMARGDAREDRALRRVVAVGQRELGRLVRAELDRHTRLSFPGRLRARLREWWSASHSARLMTVIIVSAAVGLVAWRVLLRSPPLRGPEPVSKSTAPSVAAPAVVPYRNVWDRYRGPDVDSVGSAGPAIDLTYRPSDDGHFFAALWVTGMSVDGRLEAVSPVGVGRYRGAPCVDDCLEIDLGVDAPAGMLALPVATGHLVDPRSVRFDGVQMPVLAADTGQPAVTLGRHRSGRLRYRSAPAKMSGNTAQAAWPPLPQEVADFASSLNEFSLGARANAISEYVAQHVAYDISSTTMESYRRTQDRSVGLFARALNVGAGDCDVQNALVTAILDNSGVPSRLAVGWIGSGGRARSRLHAWAEYLGADRRWRVVDASAVGGPERPVVDVIEEGQTAPHSSRKGLAEWLPLFVIFAAVLTALVAVITRRRWRREFRAGGADDVVELVRGAAVRPRTFESIHSLFSRRLLQSLSGRSISLARARKLAESGRLACGSRHTSLAHQAARRGGVVLDLDSATSSAAAEALAAVNLDRWSELVGRAEDDELTMHVGRRLRVAGEPFRVAVADGVGFEMAILDGSAFSLGNDARWVLVDSNSRLWQSLHRVTEGRPAKAAFLLADIVLHRIGAASVVRQRCLSQLALEALLEAAAMS